MYDPLADTEPFVAPSKKSGFLSFLDWIDRPGQVVRNLIRGDVGAAGRQGLDFFGDLFDAALPFDVIPEATRPEDYISGGELVGVGDPSFGKTILDVGIGLATDPLTYLSFGALPAAAKAARAAAIGSKGGVEATVAAAKAAEESAKGVRMGIPFTNISTKPVMTDKLLDPLSLAGQGISKGVSMLPEAAQRGIKEAGLTVKETLGWLNPAPAIKRGLASANALRTRATKSGVVDSERVLGALDEQSQVMLGDVFDNAHGPVGQRAVLHPEMGRRPGAIESLDQQVATLRARLEQHPEFQVLPPEAQQRLYGAIDETVRHGHTQFVDDLNAGALAHPQQYVDPTGKTYMKDELEEMYRQERRMADQLVNRGESLAGKVHDLDVETKLANKLANQPGGQAARKVQTDGGPTLNQALDAGHGEPIAWDKDGSPIPMDPFFPRLFGKLQDVDQVEIPRKDVFEVSDGDNLIWSRKPAVPRQFGKEIGPTDQLRSEFKGELQRDQTLAGKQGDIEWDLEAIDPGKFDDFTRGRGLNMQPVDVTNASPRNYLHRTFEFPDDEAKAFTADKGALADAQKSRKLNDEELVKFLNDPKNKDVKYERNAFKRLLARDEAQGRMLQKASVAKLVLGDRFDNLVDGVYKTVKKGEKYEKHGKWITATRDGEVFDQGVTAAFDEAIDAMAKVDPDSARALANAYHGMKARGPVMSLLAKANRYFKPAAVYGVILPKMGSIVRNDLGTSWQAATTQSVKAGAANMARMPARMWGAVNDGLGRAFGWKHMKPGALTKDLDDVEKAFVEAKGSADGMIAALHRIDRPDLAAAVEHGVLDGFVSSEEILKRTQSHDWWKRKFFDLYEAPSEIFQGVEQRARLGNFLDQYRGGMEPGMAAQQVRDSYLDYSVTSGKNRSLRDLVPFAAFLAGSTKQQAKFLSRTPAAGVGLAGLYAQDPLDPVTPWLQEQARVSIGDDSEGNATYLAGLGLPVEALNKVPNPFGAASIPDFGRDLERSLVASAHPLIKGSYAAVSGRDPYFGSDAFGYPNVPALGDMGDAGRHYNLASDFGLTAPADSILRVIHNATDPKKDPLARGLESLTGANVVTVDPDDALRQQLAAFLDRNPDVASARSLYSRSKDPETQELIRQMNAAKKRLKDKRASKGATSTP